MARRRSRKKAPARRRTQTVNLLGVAEGALIANAITQGVFNSDLKTFFMNTDGGSGNRASNLYQITLRELISGATGGSYGTQTTMVTTTLNGQTRSSIVGGTLSEAIKQNLNDNGLQMVGSLIAIPIAFKVGSKLARKPRALVNKVGKMSGLPMRV
jgi:hypothetical protein